MGRQRVCLLSLSHLYRCACLVLEVGLNRGLMKSFVISYRRTTWEIDCTEFDDFVTALKLCPRLECESIDPDEEIESLTSESLEVIKQMHRRYSLNEILAD